MLFRPKLVISTKNHGAATVSYTHLQAAGNLKGKYIGQKKGGYFWVFDPLPKIPVGFTFIEADDELPAELLLSLIHIYPGWRSMPSSAYFIRMGT